MTDFENIMKDLKNKIYKPIYFLMGEETYYIDQVTDYISKNVLTESEKTFNQTMMYGKDTDISTLINASRRFPMMANYQVVILKEAQEMKKFEDLIHYVEKPLKSTILVINYKYGSLNKNTKLYKSLVANASHVVLTESKKLYDNQVPDWITNYLKKLGIGIEAAASVLLNESLGNDLSKIAHELEKLSLVLPAGTKMITAAHIEKNIGISKDYSFFELNKALAQKNVLRANKIIDYFAHNPKEKALQPTIISIFNYFSKVLMYHFLPDKSKGAAASALGVNPFFVSDYEMAAKKYTPAKLVAIVAYLREYDLKSKGVGAASTPDGELLKELVFKILH